LLSYLSRRIVAIVPVGLGVLILTSLLLRVVPGDPVDTILGDRATIEEKTEMRQRLGLDLPAHKQVIQYVSQVARGDLGRSLLTQEPVTEMILTRLPATAELAVAALIVAILLAIPIGVVAAINAGNWVDMGAMTLALLGVSMPGFWLGPLLVLLFSVHWDLLPVSERTDWTSYILPAATMGTALAAVLSRMARNSMLEVLNEDYIRTARAKGCSYASILFKHALRNAALPLVTIVGLQFGVLLTGAVITERIFDWPGVGSLILDGLNSRDYPVVQGCVLFFSGSYVMVNLLTDLVYGFVDPRIRLDGK
jgi:peptide/nickel transport system permease protein